jgi:hypothetical protein
MDRRISTHTHARKRVTDLIRRYVPDFDERSDEEQIELIICTQDS